MGKIGKKCKSDPERFRFREPYSFAPRGVKFLEDSCFLADFALEFRSLAPRSRLLQVNQPPLPLIPVTRSKVVSRRKIAWIAWSNILASIDKGGLSDGSLRAQHLSLLIRWWWRFITEEVVSSLHRARRELNFISSTAKIPRNIIKAQKEFEKVNIPIASWFQISEGREGDSNQVSWALDSSGLFLVASLRTAFDDFFLKTGKQLGGLIIKCFHLNRTLSAEALLSPPLRVRFVTKAMTQRNTCSSTAQMLLEICRWWGVSCGSIFNIGQLFEWCYQLDLPLQAKKGFVWVFYAYLWSVWSFRNSKTFPAQRPNKESLAFCQLQAFSFFWFKNRAKNISLANRWIDLCSNPISCL
ncbi:hypothetical protein OSB04_006010 [Centaurea solstitialis]|uniref:Uncharacterized protein n=1 Tax=Centaurea solstitialis TaxID=347529 RepID=A0AA38TH50_9ASTR|nr:hypothetical protein OSB04_006010 [Centaurea solstitialis]